MATYTTEIASDKIVSDNPIHQRLLQAYYEAQPYVKGQVLEPGCGEGRGIAVLSPQTKEYLALDKIEEVIEKLKPQFPSVDFRAAVFPPFIGIEDNTFDTVISFQVIEHIKEDKLFLEEIHRVLKPGGQGVITTPNIKMSLSRNPWHEREYTNQELKDLAGSIFSKVEMKGIAGNEKVMAYHEQNRASVAKITKFDIFNLQYRLPNALLRIPYDLLNRLNRNNLQKQDEGLVTEIDRTDYFLREEHEENLDLFCVVTK
ncbi:class I SAM-dependent methyltransferase [Reichenbachiella carrageenanivorans]|uniref:Class I SAM-dependent methyltransferase n=1 Tax=Reichenbachiella carrageenanivorans TaxID=2979869 RepID=A0ABY6D338_9BACT|nr:class I SAM-dependent methyltransferase [Reichenbachiella carrageenanivorans]UXX80575.1 class I SAM-dependent methyltransferase [Reichenbachiella carrageenanivorans]